jgi:gamma-aminobutyric acid receptor subunit beta
MLMLLLPLLCSAVCLQRVTLINSLLNSEYDDSLRPLLGSGQPVVVALNLRVDLLYAVSSADETFAVDLFMTERWTDPRLAFNSSAFSLPYGDSLRLPLTGPWKPDTFFFNSIRCTVSDSLLKLDASGSGQVSWTRHASCTFYTPFDLSQFPFDSQQLPVQRLSFFYNSTEMRLVFSSLGCFTPDPSLDWVNSLWALGSVQCNSLQYNGRQDELEAVLLVERLWQAYVLKMIVPMFLIVIVSSLSYFIDPAAAPARVGLSVAIVLTVSTFNLLVSQDLPKINYPTLLDYFTW